jgi:hypothetical protein
MDHGTPIWDLFLLHTLLSLISSATRPSPEAKTLPLPDLEISASKIGSQKNFFVK